MPDQRQPKKPKSLRLTWLTFDQLARISRATGWSEATIVEVAISEYVRNHPEFLPKENQEDHHV